VGRRPERWSSWSRRRRPGRHIRRKELGGDALIARRWAAASRLMHPMQAATNGVQTDAPPPMSHRQREGHVVACTVAARARLYSGVERGGGGGVKGS
jgi:hypothetical protein